MTTDDNSEKIVANIPCLLCQGASRKTKFSLSATQIDSLWQNCGKNIGHAIFSEIGSRKVTLLECEECGFRYFDPALAGSGLFYDSLKDSNYYVTTKPEFDAACIVLSNSNNENLRVLDVGCGDGAFLDLAAQLGAATYGTEINEVAANEASLRGHKVFKCFLDDISSDVEKFDFISMFQVLEHVPSPLMVIEAAIKILSPGGHLLVAVPNNEGLLGLAPFSPYQWPPHHISRWRRRDLLAIAENFNLKVISVGHDPMITSQIRHHWRLRRQTLAALNRTSSSLIGSIINFASYCFKVFGANKLKLPLGHSVWVILQKTEAKG